MNQGTPVLPKHAAEMLDIKADQIEFWRHAEKISFSSEAEDLVIDRLLTTMAGNAPDHVGRYIDIGASHPVYGSNSYMFYRRGWAGVCVDPNPVLAVEWQTYRPKDRFLNVGIAPQSGVLTYHRFADPQVNGFFDKPHVDHCIALGHQHIDSVFIECLSANDFLRDYGGPVDFLTIDVESLEPAIFSAWNWALCRPKVICVEIVSRTMEAMLASRSCKILSDAGYAPISRTVHSSVFISNDSLWPL